MGENTAWDKQQWSYHAHFGGIPIVVGVDVRQWENVVDKQDVAPPQFFAWVHGVFLKHTVQRTGVQFAWEEAARSREMSECVRRSSTCPCLLTTDGDQPAQHGAVGGQDPYQTAGVHAWHVNAPVPQIGNGGKSGFSIHRFQSDKKGMAGKKTTQH